MGRRTCATRSVWRRRPTMRGAGVVVCLAGTIEPADDVVKMHASALDTFASPNGGSLGRVERDGRPDVPAARADGVTWRRPRGRRAGPPHHGDRGDGRLAAGRGRGGRGRWHRRRGDRRREHGSGAAGRRGTGDGRRDPGRAGDALSMRVAPGPRYAFPGGGATWIRAGALPVGHLCAVKAGSRWRSGWAPGSIATGWRRCWPTREA